MTEKEKSPWIKITEHVKLVSGLIRDLVFILATIIGFIILAYSQFSSPVRIDFLGYNNTQESAIEARFTLSGNYDRKKIDIYSIVVEDVLREDLEEPDQEDSSSIADKTLQGQASACIRVFNPIDNLEKETPVTSFLLSDDCSYHLASLEEVNRFAPPVNPTNGLYYVTLTGKERETVSVTINSNNNQLQKRLLYVGVCYSEGNSMKIHWYNNPIPINTNQTTPNKPSSAKCLAHTPDS